MRGVCSVWRASPPIGCSGARCSRTSPPRPERASCSCAFAVTPTTETSRSPLGAPSPRRQGCNAPELTGRSTRSSRRVSFRSSLPGARVAATQPDISFGSRLSYGPLGRPYFGPLGMPYLESGYGPLGRPEVRTSRVGRSSVALRALPGAPRSLRSLCSILIPSGLHGGGHRLRWSFPPAGGGGGRDPEAVASYRLTTQRARVSRLMMDRCQHGRFRRPADGPAGALIVAAAQPSHTTRVSYRHGRFADTVSGGAP